MTSGNPKEAVRLAPRISAAMLVKLVGLAALWFFFVHGQAPSVDAEATARAFRLQAPSKSAPMQNDTDTK